MGLRAGEFKMNSDKWAVVTGGAGFIGSHLAETLLGQGRKVRIVDDFSTGTSANVPTGAEVLEGDVVENAEEAVRGADVIYHLAGIPSVPWSDAEPFGSHRAMAESTVALLQAGERADVRRLVLASSCAVYGDGSGLPKREDQKPAPLSPYALAKVVSELYAEHWACRRSFETVSLRFSNVYGPRQDPLSPYAAAIPIFVRCLLEGQKISIFGNGSQTRDFIFVGDVVRGLIAAGTAPGLSGRIFNLATGHAISVLELVRTLARIVGAPGEMEFVPERPGDIHHSWADVSAAHRDLGFAPGTSLEAGLRETVRWLKSAPVLQH
jgi:UDP-glucose 4-epimerase